MKNIKTIAYGLVLIVIGYLGALLGGFISLVLLLIIFGKSGPNNVLAWVVSLLGILLIVGMCILALKIFGNGKPIWPYCVVAVLLFGYTIFGTNLFIKPSFDHSAESRRISDVRQLASALELYNKDHSDYPMSLKELIPTYLGEVPGPRPPSSRSVCSEADAVYRYERVSKDDFKLVFCLGKETSGYGEGIRTLTTKGIE
jgi:hypothetical protein